MSNDEENSNSRFESFESPFLCRHYSVDLAMQANNFMMEGQITGDTKLADNETEQLAAPHTRQMSHRGPTRSIPGT